MERARSRYAQPRSARLGALVALVVLAGAPACDPGPATPERPGPDVVLIVVDTLRADRLTQYGHSRDTSSHLSRLTDRATRFEDCRSPAPWTVPAVASLFTGFAPGRHRVDAVGAALPEHAPTLASDLQRAGWTTGAISFNPHITRGAGFDQGFDEFLGYRGKAGRAPDLRAMTRRALEWVDDAREDGAFFLYLQPMNVHGPYRVPDDARSALLGRPPREGFEFFGPLMQDLMNRGRVERRDEVTAEMLESLGEQYDTAVHHSAVELGRFFAALDERGLWDDALVVLTADHGEELFDHGGFAHRYSLHREVLQVPLFVKLPDQREARIVTEPVSLVDLRATLAELLELPAPASGDGRSLAPMLRGDPIPDALRDRPLVARGSNPTRFVGRSIRIADDELIVIERSYEGVENAVRLYDLAADPEQRHDLSRGQPRRVEALRQTLRTVEEERAAHPLPERRYRLDPALRRALEALGYL